MLRVIADKPESRFDDGVVVMWKSRGWSTKKSRDLSLRVAVDEGLRISESRASDQ